MQLPKDYEQATAADGRSIRMLPPGGYVCQIKAAAVNERNGKKRLEILYDVFEGEYKDFFTKQYQTGFDKGYDPQWRGVYGVNVLTNAGNTNPFFKGLLTAVQKTNPNAQLIQGGTLNEGAMKNCVVGLLIREEEYIGNDKKKHTTTRASMAVDAARIRSGDFTVPEPKRVSEPAANTAGFTEVPAGTDDGLPF